MAAGDILHGKLVLTSASQSIDTLVGAGAKTYTYVSLRKLGGAAAMGLQSTLTQANGFNLPEFRETILNAGTIIGANIGLIGPGSVDFFGITSA